MKSNHCASYMSLLDGFLSALNNKTIRVVRSKSGEPSVNHETILADLLSDSIAIRKRIKECLIQMPRHRQDRDIVLYILTGEEIPRYGE